MTTDHEREALLNWAAELDAIEVWPDLSVLLRSLAASSRDQIAEDFLKAHQGGVDAMARSLRSILDGEPCLGSEPPELFEVAQRLAAQAAAPAVPHEWPTKEMEDAAMRETTACKEDFEDADARRDFRVEFLAALAAAPQAPDLQNASTCTKSQTAPQAPAVPDRKPTAPLEWKKAVQEAYGWLWHVNNEPMAPVPMWSPEQAAYEARKNLRGLLTKDERGEAINAVSGMLRNKAEAHDIKRQP